MSAAAPAAPGPVLLVVAHGSRDPRHAATVGALLRRVRSLRPGLRVTAAYLDFDTPTVPDALRDLAVEGVADVVALPLLLTRAFHAKIDLPAVLSGAARLHLRVRRTAVLGPSPLLHAALERRLREAGLGPADRPVTGLVLASAGSTDADAVAGIADTAREWRNTGWGAVRPAVASTTCRPAGTPDVLTAVRQLRAEGARRVAVAPYVIAPGVLPDRIAREARTAGADVLAQVLGAAPELALLVLRRYDEALAPGTDQGVSGGSDRHHVRVTAPDDTAERERRGNRE
ncbi:sirohydrochlorin chelatase [Streptomyces sp. HUAS ZL42]|uniref:sirohydrochlorin chelatase n=1 Tax=Streptomyces sp. HUAS ZL42 TaxID=3231715 RepID=UPI00345E7C1A